MYLNVSDYFLADSLSQTHLSASLQLPEKSTSNKSFTGNGELKSGRISNASISPGPRRKLSHGSRSSLIGSGSENQLKQSSKSSMLSESSGSLVGKISEKDQAKGKQLSRRASIRSKIVKQDSKPNSMMHSTDQNRDSRQSSVKSRIDSSHSLNNSNQYQKLDDHSTPDSGLGRGCHQNNQSSSNSSKSMVSLQSERSNLRNNSRCQSSGSRKMVGGRSECYSCPVMHIHHSQQLQLTVHNA